MSSPTSTCLLAQSCQILCNLMDCACKVPLSIRFSRQEYWSGLLFPPPGCLPYLGTEQVSLMCPELQADPLLLSHWGSPSAAWLYPVYLDSQIQKIKGASPTHIFLCYSNFKKEKHTTVVSSISCRYRSRRLLALNICSKVSFGMPKEPHFGHFRAQFPLILN